MNLLRNLFKIDSNGNIRTWRANISSNSTIHIFSGVYGGKEVCNERQIEGKNIGKANETTKDEQAKKEIDALYTKKSKEGYYDLNRKIVVTPTKCEDRIDYVYRLGFRTRINNLPEEWIRELVPEEATVQDKPKPMLAHVLQKRIDKVEFPVLAQPKLNGNRCTAYYNSGNVILYSRGGDILNIPHIEEGLKILYDVINLPSKDVYFDGELYIHGEPLQVINSAIKKPNLNTARLKFHIYDMFGLLNFPMYQRINLLDATFQRNSIPNCIRKVETKTLAYKEDLKPHRDYYMDAGFEGLIIRNPRAEYQHKRTYDLLKYKKELLGEFKVIGIDESSKKPGIPIVWCRNDINNHKFKVSVAGDSEERQYIIDNKSKFIDTIGKVTYFERTDAPKELPYHAQLRQFKFDNGQTYLIFDESQIDQL